MKPLYKKIFRLLALSFVVWAAPLSSSEISLVQTLRKATPGDFVVHAQGKNLTLFHIFDAQENSLIIEEITAPFSLRKEIGSNWQQWVDDGAVGHSCWIMYELNLEKKSIEEMFSFSQNSWIKMYPQEQIFPTLIDLKFKLIPESKRKKAGPKPPPERIDERSSWQPPIYSQGKRIKGVQCRAYEAKWPNDGSELSQKKIEIYLPKENQHIAQYFPYWIQVSNNFAQSKMRVIDSGTNLKSIYKNLPTPPPEIISQHFSVKKNLELVLKTHPRHLGYNVYAQCVDSSLQQIELPTTAYLHETERKTKLIIQNEDLNNKLESGRMYTFIIEPKSAPYMSVETNQPIGLQSLHVK